MSLGEVGVSTAWLAPVNPGPADRRPYRGSGRSAEDPRWLLWLVAATIAALLPASALAFLVESQLACVWFLALSYVVGTAYMAPSIAAIQRLVRVEQRATASAIFLFFDAIVGSVGPFLTGVISDSLKAELGAMSLGRALLILPVAQLVAIGCYVVASQRFVREIVGIEMIGLVLGPRSRSHRYP